MRGEARGEGGLSHCCDLVSSSSIPVDAYFFFFHLFFKSASPFSYYLILKSDHHNLRLEKQSKNK